MHGEGHTDKEAGRPVGGNEELNTLNVFRGKPILEREAIVEATYLGFIKGYGACRQEPADVKSSEAAVNAKAKDYLRETLPNWLLSGVQLDDIIARRAITTGNRTGYADTADAGGGMESRR